MTQQRKAALVISLDDVGREGGEIVGGKGANLGEMRQAGIDVPPGFVVTTKAYRVFMTDNGLYRTVEKKLGGVDINDSDVLLLAAQQIQQEILAATIKKETRDAIHAAYQDLGQVPVATRSSATAEDLAAASFAGQQKTSLNVRGSDEVVQAVRAC